MPNKYIKQSHLLPLGFALIIFQMIVVTSIGVDFKSKKVLDRIDTFIENGFNPNCIVLLPEWNDPMGH